MQFERRNVERRTSKTVSSPGGEYTRERQRYMQHSGAGSGEPSRKANGADRSSFRIGLPLRASHTPCPRPRRAAPASRLPLQSEDRHGSGPHPSMQLPRFILASPNALLWSSQGASQASEYHYPVLSAVSSWAASSVVGGRRSVRTGEPTIQHEASVIPTPATISVERTPIRSASKPPRNEPNGMAQ